MSRSIPGVGVFCRARDERNVGVTRGILSRTISTHSDVFDYNRCVGCRAGRGFFFIHSWTVVVVGVTEDGNGGLQQYCEVPGQQSSLVSVDFRNISSLCNTFLFISFAKKKI